ncbi:MAG: thiamine pyrophosphate-dependent dehydrogenase E1 component subunit alpha [Magnetococcales bacterium]|nr:thiamine pyrophosphate-dependent dehydrogenase E1 component subunit alpha [Magnetococcales bacterium]
MSYPGLELYKKLYLARRCEEYIVKYYPQNDMKTPMHMSMGQEAVAVGVCHAVGSTGLVLATYRSHAAFLAHTQNVPLFFSELYGRVNGLANGKSGSMHLADPDHGHWGSSGIVASTIPIALGLAFAQKRKNTGATTVVFFGDGAIDEGSFWESINVAALMKLPVLFVCEDNGYAVHTPSKKRHGYDSIVDIVGQFRCATFSDDSNDVESICNMTQQALSIIQAGGGPVFLHIKCYRYLEHVGINDDMKDAYRPVEIQEAWLKKDCLVLQRLRLINEQGVEEIVIQQLEEQVETSIHHSIVAAKQYSSPDPSQLFHGVFYEEN